MNICTRILLLFTIIGGLTLNSCTSTRYTSSADDVYYSGSNNKPGKTNVSTTETTEYVTVSYGDTDKRKPNYNNDKRRRNARNDMFLLDVGNVALEVLCWYLWLIN